jgi:hypothetical protein
MDTILETIRAGIAPDANADAKAAAATACRAILGALDATAGEPLASATPVNAPPIANMVSALRGVPIDQLLDIAIAKLRASLPKDVEIPRVEPLRFQIVSMPQGRKP